MSAAIDQIGARIAAALGWTVARMEMRQDRGRWTGPNDDTLMVFEHGVAHLVIGHSEVMLRLSYGSEDQFLANLVSFPPDGVPTPSARDLDILRSADNATEGMLTLGAHNFGDDELLSWLS